jgi:hypothetical protein
MEMYFFLDTSEQAHSTYDKIISYKNMQNRTGRTSIKAFGEEKQKSHDLSSKNIIFMKNDCIYNFEDTKVQG